MFFIIDFEDYSAISIDFLLTFLMFLLTLKTIPMFLMTFVHLYDVSIGSDVFDLL